MSDPIPDAEAPANLAQAYARYPVLLSTVIILGVLIVLGFVALVFGIVSRATSSKPEAPAQIAAPAGPGGAVALPEGASIAAFDLDGGRIALRVVRPGAPDELWIVDAGTGAVVSRLTLTPAAP